MDNTDVPPQHWKRAFHPQLTTDHVNSFHYSFYTATGIDKKDIYPKIKTGRARDSLVPVYLYLKFHLVMHMENIKLPPVFHKQFSYWIVSQMTQHSQRQ